jgi:hypothetical protein
MPTHSRSEEPVSEYNSAGFNFKPAFFKESARCCSFMSFKSHIPSSACAVPKPARRQRRREKIFFISIY